MRLLTVLAFLTLLSTCVSAPQSAALRQQNAPELTTPVLLAHVPFFAQEQYQCGPAALAMLLGASGIPVLPERLVPLVYVPEREGSFQVEMVAATRSFGRFAYKIPPTLEALLNEVAAGRPVLVLQNLALRWYPRWHFAIVKGFDLTLGKITLNSGLDENYTMSLATFERTWARAEHWGVLALEPGAMPVQAEPTTYFTALAAFGRNNDPAQVHRAYESGLHRWPDDRNLLMGFGNHLYKEKSLDAAAERFRNLIAYHPDYAPAHNNLAQILLEQGQHEQALIHARKAVELGGDYQETYRATLLSIDPSLR
jgi:hypothetical protein